jgi:hypothetical protein
MRSLITDKMIESHCTERGYRFKPWEPKPWEVDEGPSPWPAGNAGATAWPRIQALRRKIIEDLKAEG